MRHTFVVSGGLRVEIQKSKIEVGSVLLSILYPSGDRFGCATIPAETAVVMSGALEMCAEEAHEDLHADAVGMVRGAALVPDDGPCAGLCQGVTGCRPVCLEAEGREAVAGAFAHWAVGAGVPPGRALPVVDFPQIDSRGAGEFSHAVDAINPELHAEYFDRRASDRHGEKVGA